MLISPSPIAVVRRSFDALGSPPSPMVLEVSVPRGVRTVELSWLANRVLDLELDFSDQVWRAVIENVRTAGPEWGIVGTGLAVKPLMSVVHRVSSGRSFVTRREDLEAELITAWISQLYDVDTTRSNLLGRMWAKTYKVGQRWRYSAERDLSQLTGTMANTAHTCTGGHPEIALSKAVAQGVVAPVDAEMIAATRIDRGSLQEVAQMLGLPYSTAKRRRQRAERAVTSWLSQEICD